MMFSAQPIDAEEAYRLGLVDILAEDDALEATVGGVAGQVVENSWHTNVETKKLLVATDGMTLEEGLAWEFDNYPGFAPDHAQRLARFTKK